MKKNVDNKHNKELTNKWKNVAITVGNDSLLSLLSSGDLASNEMYYHTSCYKDMINKYNAINRKVNQNDEEQKWKKAQAFDQIINYIMEKENSEPGSVFFVQDLNTMYVENRFQNGTDEQIQNYTVY